MMRDDQLMSKYLETLEKEVQIFKHILDLVLPEVNWKIDKSIYVGGGTPSLMKPSHLRNLNRLIKTYFPAENSLAKPREFTFEVMPGTETREKLELISELGVSRLSVGLQSLHESELQNLGRAHSISDVQKCLDMISKASSYFNRNDLDFVNLDLLMGAPNQTVESYLKSLASLTSYDPGHISSYILEIHEGTPFASKFKESESPLPPNDTVCDMFKHGRQYLRGAGYELYQISNYSKSEELRSSHNLMYWEGDTPYLAFGSGAASLLAGARFTRPKSLPSYFRYVEILPSILQTLESSASEQRLSTFHTLLSQVPDTTLTDESSPTSIAQSLLIGGMSKVEGLKLDILLKTLFPDTDNPNIHRHRFLDLVSDNPLLKQRLETVNGHIRPKGDEGLLVGDGLVFELSQICDQLVQQTDQNQQQNKLN